MQTTYKSDLISQLSLLRQTVSLADGSLKEVLAGHGVETTCDPLKVKIRRD